MHITAIAERREAGRAQDPRMAKAAYDEPDGARAVIWGAKSWE